MLRKQWTVWQYLSECCHPKGAFKNILFTKEIILLTCGNLCLTFCVTERPDPAHKLSANLYVIYHCCVYSEKFLMMDRGTV